MPIPSYFVLNDESTANSHGFRLLNGGGKFDRFRANPVMLHSHNRDQVIGRWDDLKVEGSELRAVPVFDTDDPEANRIAGKVDRGFVKACSPGIYIEEAQYLSLPDGKLDLVVTSWEMLEASVLGVPSHAGALAFFSKEGVQLSVDDALKSVQTLAAPTLPAHLNPALNMSKVIVLSAGAATALGITVEHDNMEAINAAVVKLEARAVKAEADLTAFRTERATALVDLAIKEGRIDATRKESFVALAIQDHKQASDILAAMPAKQELGPQTRTGASVPGDRADWTFMDWMKKDPKGLEALQAKDPAAYEALRSAY